MPLCVRLALALVEAVGAAGDTAPPPVREWAAATAALTSSDPTAIESRHVQLMSVKKTKDGHTLVKLRVHLEALGTWSPMLEWLHATVVAEKGERKTDRAPVGGLVRAITSKGKGGGKGKGGKKEEEDDDEDLG